MEWDQFIIVRAHRSILSTALLLPLLPPSSSAIIALLTYYMEARVDRWKLLGTLQIARQKKLCWNLLAVLPSFGTVVDYIHYPFNQNCSCQ